MALGDAVGDLLVAADEGGAGSPRTSPSPAQKFGAISPVGAALVQRDHALPPTEPLAECCA